MDDKRPLIPVGSDRASSERSLSDQVYDNVLAMIARGEFGVGTRLPSEQMLSLRLEVSRPILRRALKQLREDDIISSRQGSGSYVKRRPEGVTLEYAPAETIADIQRTFEFRGAIEGEAAFIAAGRRTTEDIARLRDVLAELYSHAQAGNTVAEADEAFHEAICIASDNKYFAQARRAIRANIITGMSLVRSLSHDMAVARLMTVHGEHDAIFRAILAGDVAGARHAMRDHIANSRARVFNDTAG